MAADQSTSYSRGREFGLVAVAGDVVVTASFQTEDTHGRFPVTLEFRNAKTGEVIASKAFDTFQFGGIRADTLGGKPVVEVRYSPVPPQSGTDTSVSTVFDTSAHQVWTSAGQKVDAVPTGGQLWLLPHTGGLLSHGYMIRVNAGKDRMSPPASYDILDTTGKIIMNTVSVPQLVDGFAVDTRGDTNLSGFSPPAEYRFRFLVHDLGQGGTVVAEAPVSLQVVPNNVYNAPRAMAACGSKVVLAWETGSMLGPVNTDIRLTVLDIGTGRATPPAVVKVPLRERYPQVLYGLSDPTCSTMLLYGNVIGPKITLAINLADGNLLWRKDLQQPYLSMRNGIVYAVQTPTQPAPSQPAQNRPSPTPSGASPQPKPPPRWLISLSATDGNTVSSDLAVAPLTFTEDGSPVFAESAQPMVCDRRPPATCEVTVWVGRASR